MKQNHGSRLRPMAGVLSALLLTGACTSADAPIAPRSLPTDADRGFITDASVWDALTNPRQADGEFIEVCKDFAGAGASSLSTAEFLVTGTSTPQGGGAQALSPVSLTLGNGECREIYVSELNTITDLTIGETGPQVAGITTTVQVTTITDGAIAAGSDVSATSANVSTGPGMGSLVIFTNTVSATAGCTLTLGYWKNHSEQWDATGDPNTASFLTGSTFFSSGKTYLEVLNTPPRGAAYYILAHQYIAALLNQGAGASSTGAVTAALTGAQAFFAGGAATRTQLIAWAGTLADYNEGLTGPGHCPD